jgi:hypothetical protein
MHKYIGTWKLKAAAGIKFKLVCCWHAIFEILGPVSNSIIINVACRSVLDLTPAAVYMYIGRDDADCRSRVLVDVLQNVYNIYMHDAIILDLPGNGNPNCCLQYCIKKMYICIVSVPYNRPNELLVVLGLIRCSVHSSITRADYAKIA